MTSELAAMITTTDGLDEDHTFEANCFTLAEILYTKGWSKRDHNVTIHFISVDTEGSEIDIFKVFPFEIFDIRVFVIEASRDTATPLDNIFLPRGYVKAAHLGKDAVFF